MDGRKTHETAVVLIPPEECWGPIQAIRRSHDRQFRRWMPHITLLYPFRPRALFAEATAALRAAATEIEPFAITLRELRYFRHGHSSYTVWLAPEPGAALKRLQAALQGALPDCDDLAQHPDGFTPHLSVGQVRGAAGRLSEVTQAIREGWRPLTFVATQVSLVWRNAPPDDVFRIDRHVALGR